MSLHDGAGPVNAAWGMPTSKVDATYRQVKLWILDGALAPGSTIDHNLIAERLSVSTTPLREALRRLAVEDLVEILPRRAVRVRALDPAALIDLTDVQIELEPEAVRLACRRADQALRAATAESALNAAGRGAELNRDRAIHEAIYRQCGNVVIIDALNSIYDRCQRYWVWLTDDGDDRSNASAADYQLILDAYAAGDADVAAERMRDHLRLWSDQLRAKAALATS